MASEAFDRHLQPFRDSIEGDSNYKPEHAASLERLVLLLKKRFLVRAHTDGVDETSVFREAVEASKKSESSYAIYLYSLSTALAKDHEQSGLIDDIEDSVQVAREALDITEYDHPAHIWHMNNLSVQLRHLYQATRQQSHLEEAGETALTVLGHATSKDPDWPLFLSNFSCLSECAFFFTGEMSSLHEAIQISREAVETLDQNRSRHTIMRGGHNSHALVHRDLAVQLGERYIQEGDISDAQDAEKHVDIAATMILDHRLNLPLFISKFEAMVRERFMHESRHLTADISTGDHSIRSNFLVDLAQQLSHKFLPSSTAADPLEVPTMSGIAALTQNNDYLYGLARVSLNLELRFGTFGAISDLEEAIRLGREVVENAPKDHPERMDFFYRPAYCLGLRYLELRKMADLNEAIQLAQASVDLATATSPRLTLNMSLLGGLLGTRFVRTQEPADIQNAVQIQREILNIIPLDDRHRTEHLRALSRSLRYRGQGQDLEESTRILREVLAIIPKFDRSEPVILDYLIANLGTLYRRTEDATYLDESIQFARNVVDMTKLKDPDLGPRLNNLANRLCERHELLKGYDDFEQALASYQQVLDHVLSPTAERILAGSSILSMASGISDWDRAYKAATSAVDLLSELMSRSLDNPDKQYVLAQNSGLASDAAAAAINANAEPFTVLSLLERGRGLIASSLNEIRTDVLSLRELYPELGDRFSQLASELDIPNRTGDLAGIAPLEGVHGPSRHSREAQADQRYYNGKELDELISRIRQLPDFHDFLTSASQEDIMNEAKHGPIAAINVSRYRSDAILVEEDQIRCLPLPELKYEEIEMRSLRKDQGSLETVEWLWSAVAGPVLQALGYGQIPLDESWPRVRWVPTGRLCKFPLHAAGYHSDNSGRAVCDRVISSYSTTVQALIDGRRRPSRSSHPLPSDRTALLVAMQNTPGGFSTLPFAAREVSTLRKICEAMSLTVVTSENDKPGVVSQLPQCEIFHFAGHGHTNSKDPLLSHILLRDGRRDPLTVSDLLAMNLRKQSPFLAYLSACGTGEIVKEEGFDNSMHLINAFQLAGFRHVIGTLWEVSDETCLHMARITYEEMGSGSMDDDSVSRGLHKAMRQLRDEWVMEGAVRSSRSRQEGEMLHQFAGHLHFGSAEDGSEKNRSSRDVVEMEDETDRTRSLPWFPYVHFGV